MTTLEEGLKSYLTAYAGLTALIGTRVYPFRIPQGATLPCMTYQRMDTPRMLTHQSVGATGDLAKVRMQFDCWATTYSSAKAIADQLRAALNGKTGSIGTAPNAVVIRAALVDNEIPEYNPEVDMHRVIADYFIWQEE